MGKISELTTATAITTDDYLVMVNDPGGTPATKKITAADAAGFFVAGFAPTVKTTGGTRSLALPGVGIYGSVDVALAVNTIYANYIYVATTIGFTGLNIKVQTAASGKFARMGVWQVNSDLELTTLVKDGGAVDVGSTGEKTATFAEVTLAPGKYAVGIVSDGTPTISWLSGIDLLGVDPTASTTQFQLSYVSYTYAALGCNPGSTAALYGSVSLWPAKLQISTVT